MEPRQKRKASRFGEQVGRAGWASDGFFSNKHSASELVLGLLGQISGEQVGRRTFFHKRFSTWSHDRRGKRAGWASRPEQISGQACKAPKMPGGP